MTKEKLEKEAKEYEERKHFRYEDNDYCGDIADGIIQAYIASAEPREKRIAELKNRNKELLESCEGAMMLYRDLQGAKELLTRFVKASVYFNGKETDLIEDTKQFLSDGKRIARNEEFREKRITELEAQIEKMKCGGNCEHLYHVNTGGCYDAKCDLTYCDCINCKDKWELRR